MASAGLTGARASARTLRWDLLMTGLAAAHGLLLCRGPAAPVIAIGLWWNSNTISHNFIHRSFFRSRVANALFGFYLSLLLGIPQSLWRDRHMAHHAGRRPRLHVTAELISQTAAVLALWAALAAWAPHFLLSAYLPGYLGGLAICALHGHYEHAHGTTSHYGRLYNLLFFNDGFHAEHHAHPTRHWSRLSEFAGAREHGSPWPAPLRWIAELNLESLERLALRFPVVLRWLVQIHARAIRPLLKDVGPIHRVAIVGGGLFPRTALVFRRLLPGAHLTIIDVSRDNLDRGRSFLGDADCVHARFPNCSVACDLLVIPLAFTGDRESIYRDPPAPAVVIHDWVWRRRGEGRRVSLALLKRVNLVRR